MRGGRRWIVVGLLLVLHFALHPVWSSWTAGPDLLAGGLLLGALGLRPGRAALLGFLLGLLEASMALGPLGPTMIVLAMAGYAGAWLRDVFYSDSGRFMPIFILIGVLAIQVGFELVGGGPSASPDGARFLYIPVSAAVTAAVCWGFDRLVGVFAG